MDYKRRLAAVVGAALLAIGIATATGSQAWSLPSRFSKPAKPDRPVTTDKVKAQVDQSSSFEATCETEGGKPGKPGRSGINGGQDGQDGEDGGGAFCQVIYISQQQQ